MLYIYIYFKWGLLHIDALPRTTPDNHVELSSVCVFCVKGAEQEKSGVHEIFSNMSGVKTVSSCATGSQKLPGGRADVERSKQELLLLCGVDPQQHQGDLWALYTLHSGGDDKRDHKGFKMFAHGVANYFIHG